MSVFKGNKASGTSSIILMTNKVRVDMTNMVEEENKNVMDCVETVNTNFPRSFILVGGASMVKRHSERSTTDVDVLESTIPKRKAHNSLQSGHVQPDAGVSSGHLVS